ncbi:MAG: hypothetical protein ACI91B_003979 [Planctomycetota bacterium]
MVTSHRSPSLRRSPAPNRSRKKAGSRYHSSGFGQVPTAVHEELLRAPTHSYVVLDKECMRRTDACLISRGCNSWGRPFPERFATAFAQHARTLCRTSNTLGQLAPPQRDALVQQIMSGPLAHPTNDASATALVERLDRHGPATSTSPVPKKLRQHIAGDLQLSEAQLERAAKLIRAAWPAVIADQVQEVALAHMARKLSTDEVDLATLDDQMLHALKLQSRLVTNQRALRRLLRACHRGDDDYLLQHPISQAWLQEHQSISERWLEGITRPRDLEGHGTLTLAIENNPLEALRMGTHVGSSINRARHQQAGSVRAQQQRSVRDASGDRDHRRQQAGLLLGVPGYERCDAPPVRRL